MLSIGDDSSCGVNDDFDGDDHGGDDGDDDGDDRYSGSQLSLRVILSTSVLFIYSFIQGR